MPKVEAEVAEDESKLVIGKAKVSLCLTLFVSTKYNVTSLVHSYIVITVFSRPSFRAIVSALLCLLVFFSRPQR